MRLLTMAAIAAALVAQTAYADEPAVEARFRSPAPTPFTAEDVERFAVDPAIAAKIQELRREGYEVMALPADQLDELKAGASSTTWIIVGVVAAVVIIAAASGGGGGGY